MMVEIFDEREFAKIVAQADNLKDAQSGKVSTLEDSEDLYFMDWDDEARVKSLSRDIKITKSPDGRNMLKGAQRLLSYTEPVWSVPREANDEQAKEIADPIEEFAKKMYMAMSGTMGKKAHVLGALSALLHDEIHIAVISTADLLKYAEENEDKKGKSFVKRAKQVAMRTPYLWKVWNAKSCYFEEDMLGMSAHYRETDSTARQIMGDWGADAVPEEAEATDTYTLCEWWDLEYHAVWLDEERSRPILMEEHGLPFIPIYSTLVEGERDLFPEDASRQNQPFLYTLARSGMADRQNMALTVWMTNLFAMGANTQYLAEMANPEEEIMIDNSVMGGVTKIRRGDSLKPMPRELVPEELINALNMMDDKVSESTMYRQALGQPIGGTNTFSTIALLSQSGRLPLSTTKDKLGQALAGAMRISLMWIKEQGGKARAKYGAMEMEIAAKDIPEDIELECTIEVALPQDKLQNSNIASNLTQGDNPLTSNRWARENILNIGQSEQMDREIWTERAGQLMYQQYLEKMIMEAQAMEQQQQGQAQGGMMPPPGQGMGVPPGNGAMGPPGMAPPGGAGMPNVMQEGPAGPGELPGEQQMGMDDGGMPPGV